MAWFCGIAVLLRRLLLVGLLGLVGCTADGADPFAGWQKFTHADGAFYFYYLSPPWTFSAASTSVHPLLQVDPYPELTDGHLGSRISLEAWVSGDFCADTARLRQDLWSKWGYGVDEFEAYQNHDGQGGLRMTLHFRDHYAVDMFLPIGKGCAVLSMVTNDVLVWPEVQQMAMGFGSDQAVDR